MWKMHKYNDANTDVLMYLLILPDKTIYSENQPTLLR